jgi:exonuclease VII small subunit
MKTKIEVSVDPKQLDDMAKEAIQELQRVIKGLEAKNRRLEDKIVKLQGGMDVTSSTRSHIKKLAQELKEELESAGWAEYDRSF